MWLLVRSEVAEEGGGGGGVLDGLLLVVVVRPDSATEAVTRLGTAVYGEVAVEGGGVQGWLLLVGEEGGVVRVSCPLLSPAWLGVGGVDFEVTRGGSMRGSTVGEVLMRYSRDSCL